MSPLNERHLRLLVQESSLAAADHAREGEVYQALAATNDARNTLLRIVRERDEHQAIASP